MKLLGAGPTKDFSLDAQHLLGHDGRGGLHRRGRPAACRRRPDLGFNSQIRILGVGGNESLGQQRVPVIITSAHDNTVGTTVRGVAMNTLITGDTQAPAAGDGGIIYFGANSLFTYNLFDPREGNRIDNADLRYMSRVELQGGGIYDQVTANPLADLPGDAFLDAEQREARRTPISNTNISNFRDVGIYEHPGFGAQALPSSAPGRASPYGSDPAGRQGVGRGIVLFLVNSTIANTPIGIQVNGAPSPACRSPPPTPVLLNNTFYNDAQAFRGDPIQTGGQAATATSWRWTTSSPTRRPPGSTTSRPPSAQRSSASRSTTSSSQRRPTPNVDNQPTPADHRQPALPQPGGRELQPAGAVQRRPSSAIDAARSEIGPSFFGGLLTPIATQSSSPAPAPSTPPGSASATRPTATAPSSSPCRACPAGLHRRVPGRPARRQRRRPRPGVQRRHLQLHPDQRPARPGGLPPPGRPERPQRRVRQPAVLRHRCLRVPPALPAPRHRRHGHQRRQPRRGAASTGRGASPARTSRPTPSASSSTT